MSAKESELVNNKAWMDALQHQELLESGLDAELKQQAKLALSFAAGFEFLFFFSQH